ncbi:hypothetical protein GCM10020255_005970 [Rhodococcus baikonurensis]
MGSGHLRAVVDLAQRRQHLDNHGALSPRRSNSARRDGELVPIISGNSFRGTLRRIGEELLRDVLDYEGTLSLPAATPSAAEEPYEKPRANPSPETDSSMHEISSP